MLARACEIKIQCKDEDLEIISSTLPCEIKKFPCTYLGLPLAIRKPSKAELLPLIDKVANSLPGWKASLMNRAGHLITVLMVLTSIPIYLVIALDLPKRVFKAIDGAFLGKANGGLTESDGYGCRKQTPHGHGLDYPSRTHKTLKRCSVLLWRLLLAVNRTPCSGLITGCRVEQLLS